MQTLQKIIEQAYENRTSLSPMAVPPELRDAIFAVIAQLNNGTLRVAEKINHVWITHGWIKKAVLLFFAITPTKKIENYYDKIPLKFSDYSEADFMRDRVRVVPSAIVRTGAFVGENTILMPCFVNIGAYIDTGTLIDTWATVGSCAQIGKKVHISGGVGIGGVLEPLQASPTIIEDNCFIGARSEIVEGVIVEKNAVISMGVYIGKSTPIYNRETDEIIYGRVPAGSVVIPGSLPAPNGKYARYAAIIMKQVDEKTREKTAINELLRC